MNAKLMSAVMVGLIAGLFISSFGWQQTAHGQQEKAPRWEYKVESFSDIASDSTERLNKLAADGWEYVGLISTVRAEGAAFGKPAQVAFKRSKK